jgi:hypothetical protein
VGLFCGEEDTRKIDALSHDYGALEEVVAATCTEEGYKAKVCSHCGDEIEKETIPALGHDFGDWEEITAATCIADGEETRTCSRCDEEETQPINALGHDYGELVVVLAATCDDEGYKAKVCSRCDDETEKETIPKLTGEDCGETSIGDILVDQSAVTLYPNPTADKLYIQTTETIKRIEIYNAQGQVVKIIQNNVREISVNDLKAGIYTLRITTDKGFASQRFVKE